MVTRGVDQHPGEGRAVRTRCLHPCDTVRMSKKRQLRGKRLTFFRGESPTPRAPRVTLSTPLLVTPARIHRTHTVHFAVAMRNTRPRPTRAQPKMQQRVTQLVVWMSTICILAGLINWNVGRLQARAHEHCSDLHTASALTFVRRSTRRNSPLPPTSGSCPSTVPSICPRAAPSQRRRSTRRPGGTATRQRSVSRRTRTTWRLLSARVFAMASTRSITANGARPLLDAACPAHHESTSCRAARCKCRGCSFCPKGGEAIEAAKIVASPSPPPPPVVSSANAAGAVEQALAAAGNSPEALSYAEGEGTQTEEKISNDAAMQVWSAADDAAAATAAATGGPGAAAVVCSGCTSSATPASSTPAVDAAGGAGTAPAALPLQNSSRVVVTAVATATGVTAPASAMTGAAAVVAVDAVVSAVARSAPAVSEQVSATAAAATAIAQPAASAAAAFAAPAAATAPIPAVATPHATGETAAAAVYVPLVVPAVPVSEAAVPAAPGTASAAVVATAAAAPVQAAAAATSAASAPSVASSRRLDEGYAAAEPAAAATEAATQAGAAPERPAGAASERRANEAISAGMTAIA